MTETLTITLTVELTLTEARCLIGAASYYRHEVDATGRPLADAIRKVRTAADKAAEPTRIPKSWNRSVT